MQLVHLTLAVCQGDPKCQANDLPVLKTVRQKVSRRYEHHLQAMNEFWNGCLICLGCLREDDVVALWQNCFGIVDNEQTHLQPEHGEI